MKILKCIVIMLFRIVSGVMDFWASGHDGSYVVNIPKIYTVGESENFSLCSEDFAYLFTRNPTCFCLNESPFLHPRSTRSQAKGFFLCAEHLCYVSHIYVSIEVLFSFNL
jgi:hypothetical protein